MAENNTQEDGVQQTDEHESLTAAVTAAFKVLGQIDDSSGVGVLGQNDATSGAPIGVQGAVPNAAEGYGLATPDDVRVEGTVDTDGTDFVVETGTTSTADARNVVQGHASNSVANSVVGATIGGGGQDDGNQNFGNEVNDDYGTVSGGRRNTAYRSGTVGGGVSNTAFGLGCTVAGGSNNSANGDRATVGGGYLNDARATHSTIAGGGPSDTNNPTSTSNTVYDEYGTIGGGGNNQAGEDDGNATVASYATVSGGRNNAAVSQSTTVGGGSGNTAGVADGNQTTGGNATVAGGSSNTASGDISTIAGGYDNTASGDQSFVGSGKENRAKSSNAVIGGGFDNVALGGQTTIGGGYGNRIFDEQCTVAGGQANQAGSDDSGLDSATDPGNQNLDNDTHATVGGGHENVASGSYATVPGGRKGEARDDGTFVWADSTDATFASDQSGTGSSPTGADTFHVRATGGVRFVTGLDVSDDPDAGQYLSAGGSSWQTVSARAAKRAVSPVDPESVLSGVEDLDVSTWEYDANEGVRRMGPMAEEFSETFGLGDDPETIGHVDADGVALAAIQGLAERGAKRDERISELEAELDRKEERLQRLETRLAALEDGTEAAGED